MNLCEVYYVPLLHQARFESPTWSLISRSEQQP